MRKNQTIYHTSQYLDEQFYCPNCGESLQPMDIETIARCPYCDTVIPQDNRYEDYVLRPLVQRWVEHAVKQFPRHS